MLLYVNGVTLYCHSNKNVTEQRESSWRNLMIFPYVIFVNLFSWPISLCDCRFIHSVTFNPAELNWSHTDNRSLLTNFRLPHSPQVKIIDLLLQFCHQWHSLSDYRITFGEVSPKTIFISWNLNWIERVPDILYLLFLSDFLLIQMHPFLCLVWHSQGNFSIQHIISHKLFQEGMQNPYQRN